MLGEKWVNCFKLGSHAAGASQALCVCGICRQRNGRSAAASRLYQQLWSRLQAAHSCAHWQGESQLARAHCKAERRAPAEHQQVNNFSTGQSCRMFLFWQCCIALALLCSIWAQHPCGVAPLDVQVCCHETTTPKTICNRQHSFIPWIEKPAEPQTPSIHNQSIFFDFRNALEVLDDKGWSDHQNENGPVSTFANKILSS